MEKKLPEDNLERFLRSSFKDFKQEPSDKVWDSIEAGLSTTPVPVKRIKPWMYWTVAASVLGLIILFQFKFNQNLNKKLEQVLQQNELLSKQSPAQGSDLESELEPVSKKQTDNSIAPEIKDGMEKNNGSISLAESKSPNSSEKIQHESPNPTEITTLASKNQPLPTDPNATRIETTKNKIQPERSRVQIKENVNLTDRSVEQTNTKNLANRDATNRKSALPDNKEKTSNTTAPRATSNDFTGIKNNPTSSTGQERGGVDSALSTSSPIERDLDLIPARSVYAVALLDQNAADIESAEQEKLHFAGGLMAPIPVNQRANQSKGIQLGLYGGLLIEKGEITPKRFFDPRINDFPKNEYTSSNSWTAGIEVNKPIHRNWSISSGVGIKHFEFINELTQSLAFKNREQPNPGNLPFQHDFLCKIPGPTGTADIIINSEQLDSRASISDAEQIKITIKNQSKLNYLTLPLALAFQINKGRLSAFVKTGLQADIFLSRTVDEPQITLSHPQLQLRQDRPMRPRVNIHSANPIVLNAMVSTGIQYQVGPAWSVSLNPGLILPFTQREFNRDIKVDSKMYSLQLGINYTLSSL